MRFYLWSFVLVVGIPLFLVFGLSFLFKFPTGKVASVIFAIHAPIAVLIPWLALQFSVVRTNDSVVLTGANFYTVEVSADEVAKKHVISNVSALGELRPVLRTNGIGLPGLAVGNFKLQNGSAAMLFVHDSEKPLAVLNAEAGENGTVVIVNDYLLSK